MNPETSRFYKVSLHTQIFIGLILGVLLGWMSRQFNFTSFVINDLLVGDLFLRALKMVIIPLIFSSIVTGITGIGQTKNIGKLGFKTLAYYLTTSLIAILTGLFFVNLIQPGKGIDIVPSTTPTLSTNTVGFGDILKRIIPENPIAAMADGDMLSIIFFGLLTGYFITQVKDPYRNQLSQFFEGVFDVMMKMTHFIIKFAPLGIFALTAATIAKTGFDVFKPLAGYTLTVVLGLLFHAGVTLPLLLRINKIAPLRYFKAMSAALLTAFSTSSSSATLPLTMTAVEKNAKISHRISSFVLPLGSTINMDGTALYECVAALFIAQVYGIELSVGQQMLIVLTALLASVGAAGIPMAGLVMLTLVLKSVGLPLEGIGFIIAVDRVLDMIRTTVNVWSDMCGAALIAKHEGETLSQSV